MTDLTDEAGAMDATYADAVERHLRRYFAGHAVTREPYDLGDGSRGSVSALRVLAAEPGPRYDGWTYATAGCDPLGGREFVLTAPAHDPRFADLLAMAAHHHGGSCPHPLEVGHGLSIGEPWLPGSACDHLLVSLPYLHGPELEHCPLPDDGRARFLWLLPVTATELAHRSEHGLEALERLFDQAAIDPVDPRRAAVV